MVTSNGRAVPPPTEEHLDATLWRVYESLSRQITTDASAHTNRRRRWGAATAAVASFGVGLALGGAALPAVTDPAPPFEVQCFDSSNAQLPEVTMGFSTPAQVATGRQDPAAACGTAQIQKSVSSSDIVSIVNRLVGQGAGCGLVTTDDGTTWSFQSGPNGMLSMTNGTLTTPMSGACISVHVAHVTPPSYTTLTGVACSVDAAQARVYPGDAGSAATICRAHGLSTYTAP